MKSIFSEEDNLDLIFSAIEITTVVLGFAIFLANFTLVVFMCKHFILNNATMDKQGFLVQTAFISVNDTLCGLVLFVIGFIQVKSQVTAYLCVYVTMASITLQLVSQGNLACICIQRYICVRNIRMQSRKVQTYFTRILMAVNITVGLLSMISFVSMTRVKDIANITSELCALTPSTEKENALTFSAYFVFGMIFTLISDIMSFWAIKKLKTEVNNAIQPSSSNTNSFRISSGQHSEIVRNSTKLRQRKATITICLILLFINLSFVPSLLSFIAVYMGIIIDYVFRRILLLSFFINSLVNPIIIVTRIEEMRLSIRQALRNVFRKFTSLFSAR